MIPRRRIRLLAVAAVWFLALIGAAPAGAQQRVQVEFWHGLPMPLGGILEKIVADFNASQGQYQVNPSYKGSYPETMVAAIAAFRAGNAPHIVQMFEVGTATMMAARSAIKPVYELMREAGVPFEPKGYLPAVRGYYSLPDGRMMAMPFNSSTAIMWYSKDAFRKAGLDPAKAPQTWPELREAARKIKAANAAPCAFTTAWLTWTQFEQFSAIHDVPFATKANGMTGLDAELKINSPLHVRHVQTLMEMQKEGTFKYGGRDAAGDALFPSGECAIIHASSGLRARIGREAKFDWAAAMLPYWPGAGGAPKNSIIGGASFWVMTAPSRRPEEYRAVAEFFRFISTPEIAARWHMETGFLPVTFAGWERAKGAGYYDKNPGADVPILELTRTQPTDNSRGLRLGNLPEIRNIIQEEVEKALQGQQTAQQALDTAVQRGNVVLRNFERANR
ncbi:MAG TPA: sn-glycerol-3-phosphate ABC transporter substrate-binding protein UgpB [Methylomirabilota bacterium]|nr:sn-glycerol-3-phosphate ABC transporter substrate-binding protein UgpB [Methylomirabilota bacterium]